MLRFLTAGESHGPMLTAILEGMVAGLPLQADEINKDLARRQKGFGAGGRMSIEVDRVRITAGVMNGLTTGGPIGILIENRDWKNWKDGKIEPFTVPRPGHADLTGAIKYAYRDLRLSLERASARETAARGSVGAICRGLLAKFGIQIGSYVTMIGGVAASLPADPGAEEYLARFDAAEADDVRCPEPEAAAEMRARIKTAMKAGDTLGGVFEVVVLGLPPGLGSYVQADRRLDARLLAALGTVPAVKGAEIGRAFELSARPGTQAQDAISVDQEGNLLRASNHAGGLEGGISTGQPLVVRAAMKPLATTVTPAASVDLATGQSSDSVYERSDFCAVPRAAVVGEAVVAFVLADALLEKLGGDSLEEIRPRFAALRRGHLDDLPMDNQPWSFGFEE